LNRWKNYLLLYTISLDTWLIVFSNRSINVSRSARARGSTAGPVLNCVHSNLCHSSCSTNAENRFLSLFHFVAVMHDRHCGLVVRVPGYRSRGPGSIPDFLRNSWSGTWST
jgi:hypothetical protein